MYNGGGKVFITGEKQGWVFLVKDEEDIRVPRDLIEQAGILATKCTLLSSIERAKIGGYVRHGSDAVFVVERSQYPLVLQGKCEVFWASEINQWNPWANRSKWQLNENDFGWELRIPWDEISQHSPFSFKFVTLDGDWLEPCSDFPLIEINHQGIANYRFDSDRSGKDVYTFEAVMKERVASLDRWLGYRPQGQFGHRQTVSGGHLFRLFAPRALHVDLLLYNKPNGSDERRFPLVRENDGSWFIEIDHEEVSPYYMFAVSQKFSDKNNSSFEKKILDPYALATTGRDGPGIIVPTPAKIPLIDKFCPPDVHDLVILEGHVRDLLENSEYRPKSSQSGWFKQLREWIHSDECYLKKIGINAIEFQPLQEFDSKTQGEYHWGYMPVNFFSPESSYSSSPQDGSVVEEMKLLVDALHDAGIAVILDVVYNHVGIPGHLLNLDRELYFRIDELGRLQNFSGCGNDLNCESEPVRKLILDSLVYWVEVFDIDGFRFDLAELIGAEFLQEIECKLRQIKPNIILIAEPWSFRGRLSEKISETNFSLWSDQCRESVFSLINHGLEKDKVVALLRGQLDCQKCPWQSVNYIESHDDYSFLDRICDVNQFLGKDFPASLIARNRLALIILLLSPGIPMISAGQDFMRHKKGVRNTYLRGDLNALNYDDLKTYSALSRQISEVISFRLSENGQLLRPREISDFQYDELKYCPEGIIALEIKCPVKKDEILLIFNFTNESLEVPYPQKWMQSICSLSNLPFDGNSTIPEYGFQVLSLTGEP